MTIFFKCSKCGNSKCARHKYYQSYLKKYGCTNPQELSEKYVCRTCITPIRRAQKRIEKKNRKLNDDLSKNEFTRLGRFIFTRVAIQMQVNKLKKVGIQDEMARTMFLSAVKNILDKAGFLEYHLVIENGTLKGIMLKKVPLYNEVLMELQA